MDRLGHRDPAGPRGGGVVAGGPPHRRAAGAGGRASPWWRRPRWRRRPGCGAGRPALGLVPLLVVIAAGHPDPWTGRPHRRSAARARPRRGRGGAGRRAAGVGTTRVRSRAARPSSVRRGARAAAGRPGGRRAALPDGGRQPAGGRRPRARRTTTRRGAIAPSTPPISSRTIASAAATARSIRCTPSGLSLLILPAYAAGGYAAVSFFMAILGVATAWQVRELVRETLADSGVADAVGWIAGVTPPLLHFAGLVFTEVPAALGLTVALRMALTPPSVGARVGRGPAARVAAVAERALRDPGRHRAGRRRWCAGRPFEWRRDGGLPMAASAAALAAYHHVLYGFFDPRRVYGQRPEFSAATIPTGLPGLFFDQEFGLWVYAPVFALAVPGLVRLARSPPAGGGRRDRARGRRARGGVGVADVARAASIRPRASSCRCCPRWRWGSRAG